MFSTALTDRVVEFDPFRSARSIGLLYLILLVLGPFSLMVVPQAAYVLDDPAATASRIATNGQLLRWGLFCGCLVLLVEILVCAHLYQLFRYVHQQSLFIAISARLLMVAAQAVSIVFQGAALVVSEGGETVFAMTAGHAASLALALIHIQLFSVHVWEVLFALHCLFLGVLIYRSTFLPRVLGALMLVASVGYGLNGFGNLVAPEYSAVYLVGVSLAVLLGELPMMFWLLLKKVDIERWHARRSLWMAQ